MSWLRSFGGRVAIGMVLAGVVASPGAARAETTACTFDGTMAEPGVDCRRVECSDDVPCSTAVFGTDAICAPLVSTDDASYCRRACGTMFGCSADSACPEVAGATGQCVTLGPATPTDPVGICVYPAAQIDYCPAAGGDGTVIGHYLATCHTTPTGEVTANYFLGDCDADGCPNGSDGTPCVAGEDVCGAVMHGGECAPGSALDGGVATPDASIDADGGNAQDDAGGQESDAGEATPDGGASAMDAGPPPASFHGGGGCTCRVGSRAAPGSSTAVGALAVGALALVVMRRRRR